MSGMYTSSKTYTEIFQFTAAREQCKADGAHLPIPKTEAENQWYKNYAAKVGLSYYWLGISDNDLEGEWKTDKGDLQIYSNWNGNEPNNYRGNEDYVAVKVDNGKWLDVPDTWGHSKLLCTFILEGSIP